MAIFDITGIEWDLTSDGEDAFPHLDDDMPPDEVREFYVNVHDEDDIEQQEADVMDALSDEYGWCILSCAITRVSED